MLGVWTPVARHDGVQEELGHVIVFVTYETLKAVIFMFVVAEQLMAVLRPRKAWQLLQGVFFYVMSGV